MTQQIAPSVTYSDHQLSDRENAPLSENLNDWSIKKPTAITAIDTHAHVFAQALPLAAVRRHTPEYDASIEAYIVHLHENRISHAVLVQPSFLGTDNAFLLDVLKAHPFRLRGVAMVSPHVSDQELERLAKAGIVGIRLNLVGLPLPDFTDPLWQSLFARINALGWHVELHREAVDLPALIKPLLQQKCRVVVDHFGRPDQHLGIADPGFNYLLSIADTGQIWIKLSAAYRSVSSGDGHLFGAQATRLLLNVFSPTRLLWGSDWPHTQHEKIVNYGTELAVLATWVPDDEQRKIILGQSAHDLFHFESI